MTGTNSLDLTITTLDNPNCQAANLLEIFDTYGEAFMLNTLHAERPTFNGTAPRYSATNPQSRSWRRPPATCSAAQSSRRSGRKTPSDAAVSASHCWTRSPTTPPTGHCPST